MCPPGYHYNGFMATHALGHMIYGYTLLVPMAVHAVVKQYAAQFILQSHHICLFKSSFKFNDHLKSILSQFNKSIDFFGGLHNLLPQKG